MTPTTIIVLKSGYTINTPGHVANEIAKGMTTDVITIGGSFIVSTEIAAVMEVGAGRGEPTNFS